MGTNCYTDHGAEDIESIQGASLGFLTFPECKAMCNFRSDCDGIVMRFLNKDEISWKYGESTELYAHCYRRAHINLTACDHTGSEYDTWIKGSGRDYSVSASNPCDSLNEDQCRAQVECRLCRRRPYTRSFGTACVPDIYADSYFGDGSCEEPEPHEDPCKNLKNLASCSTNECRWCTVDSGVPMSNCMSEIPVAFPGYCKDTADHKAAYKTCARPGGTCEGSTLCKPCEFSHTNVSWKVCIDKDDFPTVCNTALMV